MQVLDPYTFQGKSLLKFPKIGGSPQPQALVNGQIQGVNLTVSRSKMLHIWDIMLHKFQLV